jgi:Flp pilus assembly protein TadG
MKFGGIWQNLSLIRPARSALQRLAKDDRGNALVMVAASFPLMLAAAGMGVDTVSLSLARRDLQRSADSGALAGAHALVQEKNVDTSVNHDLSFNNQFSLRVKSIQSPPEAGSYAANPLAVRVVLTAARSTPFMSFFTKTTPDVTVEATAAVVYTGKFCMVSLEDGTAPGVSFGGNTLVDLGCGVSTNSKGTSAISAGGSSTIIASPIAAMGAVPASSSYATGTKLLPYSPKQQDPYERLPIPQVPQNCNPNPLVVQPNAVRNLPSNPSGIYCYTGGIDVKGTLHLPPGTYYINGGSLSAGANAVITGTGVTIILTSSTAASDPSSVAKLEINGSAQLNLSAPKTGTYGGILMYQDPRAALGNTVRINGNSSSSFEGGFYFPKAYLTYNGTTGMRTECLQIVARRLEFTGNSKVSNTCPTDGAAKAFDASFVRLVA